MKLLIAGITFAATLGGLFLFENYRTQPKEETYAQIIGALKSSPAITAVKNLNKPAVRKPASTAKTPEASNSATPASPTPSNTNVIIQTASFTPTPVISISESSSILTPTPPPTGGPSTTPAPTPTPSPTPRPTPKQSEKININTAALGELDNITGIGPVIAQRIIDYRNAYGPFQKIEDIKNVSGIKDAKFEAMKNEITVSAIP